MAKGTLRGKQFELTMALRGHVTEHRRFLLGELMEDLQFVESGSVFSSCEVPFLLRCLTPFVATVLSACALALNAQQQTPASSSDAQLLQVMIPAGAYAESLTQFCESGNRREAGRYGTVLKSWAQRNHCPAIQIRLNADAALQNQFANRKTLFAGEFAAHRFKTAFACGLLPQMLATTARDPSLQHRAELEALDHASKNIPVALDGSGNATETPSATHGSAPQAEAATAKGWPSVSSKPSGLVVAKTGEAADVAPAKPITAGTMTFQPPAGWQVTENTPQRTVLQAATEHTKALLFIEQVPLSGVSAFRTPAERMKCMAAVSTSRGAANTAW